MNGDEQEIPAALRLSAPGATVQPGSLIDLMTGLQSWQDKYFGPSLRRFAERVDPGPAPKSTDWPVMKEIGPPRPWYPANQPVPTYTQQTVTPQQEAGPGLWNRVIWPNIRDELFGAPTRPEMVPTLTRPYKPAFLAPWQWTPQGGLYDWAGFERPTWMLPKAGEAPTVVGATGVSLFGIGNALKPSGVPTAKMIPPMPIAPATMRRLVPPGTQGPSVSSYELARNAPTAQQYKAMFEKALSEGRTKDAQNIIRNAYEMERTFIPSDPLAVPMDIFVRKMGDELKWLGQGGQLIPREKSVLPSTSVRPPMPPLPRFEPPKAPVAPRGYGPAEDYARTGAWSQSDMPPGVKAKNMPALEQVVSGKIRDALDRYDLETYHGGITELATDLEKIENLPPSLRKTLDLYKDDPIKYEKQLQIMARKKAAPLTED